MADEDVWKEREREREKRSTWPFRNELGEHEFTFNTNAESRREKGSSRDREDKKYMIYLVGGKRHSGWNILEADNHPSLMRATRIMSGCCCNLNFSFFFLFFQKRKKKTGNKRWKEKMIGVGVVLKRVEGKREAQQKKGKSQRTFWFFYTKASERKN